MIMMGVKGLVKQGRAEAKARTDSTRQVSQLPLLHVHTGHGGVRKGKGVRTKGTHNHAAAQRAHTQEKHPQVHTRVRIHRGSKAASRVSHRTLKELLQHVHSLKMTLHCRPTSKCPQRNPLQTHARATQGVWIRPGSSASVPFKPLK